MVLSDFDDVEPKFKRAAIGLGFLGYGSILGSIVFSLQKIYATRYTPPTSLRTIYTRNGEWGPLPYVLIYFTESCPSTCELGLEDGEFYNQITGERIGKVGQHIAYEEYECHSDIMHRGWPVDHHRGWPLSNPRWGDSGCHVLINATAWSPRDSISEFEFDFIGVRAQQAWVYTAAYDIENAHDFRKFVFQFDHEYTPSLGGVFFELRMDKTIIPSPGVFVGWPWEGAHTQELVNLEVADINYVNQYDTRKIMQFELRLGNPIVTVVAPVSIISQCRTVIGTLGGLLAAFGAGFHRFVRKFPKKHQETTEDPLLP